MLIAIDQVLSLEEVHQFRQVLDAAEWEDGLNTAGTLARSSAALAAGQHITLVVAPAPAATTIQLWD